MFVNRVPATQNFNCWSNPSNVSLKIWVRRFAKQQTKSSELQCPGLRGLCRPGPRNDIEAGQTCNGWNVQDARVILFSLIWGQILVSDQTVVKALGTLLFLFRFVGGLAFWLFPSISQLDLHPKVVFFFGQQIQNFGLLKGEIAFSQSGIKSSTQLRENTSKREAQSSLTVCRDQCAKAATRMKIG